MMKFIKINHQVFQHQQKILIIIISPNIKIIQTVKMNQINNLEIMKIIIEEKEIMIIEKIETEKMNLLKNMKNNTENKKMKNISEMIKIEDTDQKIIIIQNIEMITEKEMMIKLETILKNIKKEEIFQTDIRKEEKIKIDFKIKKNILIDFKRGENIQTDFKKIENILENNMTKKKEKILGKKIVTNVEVMSIL